ncbi:MAG: hypothetical protein A3E87_08220 [Gammaproteobacteria bacterium RIFCSPHIGHO2_12_FULL_35_23]|nr:MAG: hypothetical protein A3E87_08220 [Gammaproteobacteria bacterium RIFCSPHIGHO2_12_FULL_35_23]
MAKITEQINMALSLGQLLKIARERANLSQDDIADYLRINKEIVAKIENDQFQDDEISVYIRGYIRAYAKYVGVPSQEVETYFLNQGIINEPQIVKQKEFIIKDSITKPSSFKMISYGIIIILIILVLIWLFWQRNSNNELSATTSPVEISVPAAHKAVPMVLVTPSVSSKPEINSAQSSNISTTANNNLSQNRALTNSQIISPASFSQSSTVNQSPAAQAATQGQ